MLQQTVTQALSKVQGFLTVLAAVAFGAGYVIAVIAGIWWPDQAALIVTLVILGLVVGLLNITSREIIPYLVAAIALVLVGTSDVFGSLNLVANGLGDGVNDIVRMMATFTAPAAVVQAIRAGVSMARPGGAT